MEKNLPSMQEIWVQSLGQEDPLEQEILNILAWRISWIEEPGSLQSIWSKKVRYDVKTNTFIIKWNIWRLYEIV